MAAWYGKDYVRLQQEIRGLATENVESYDIRYVSNKVKTLPPEIGRLSNLKRLYIYSAQNLEYLPNELGKLKELEELLVYHCAINQLPSTIEKLQKLERLYLSGLKFDKTTNWQFLQKLKSLKKLMIRSSIPKLKTILPQPLFEAKSLVYLDLASNNLTSLPKELAQLENLESLCVLSNEFSTFPKVITAFPKLKTLKINVKDLDQNLSVIAQLPKDLVIEGNKNEKKSQEVLTILQVFQRGKQLGFSKAFRSLLLKILNKDSKTIKELPQETLCALLNTQISFFENKALTELSTRGQQQQILSKYPINEKANILVLGKIVGKRELTQKLKQYGAKIRRKFSPNITHLVIGKRAETAYAYLKEPNVVGVTEKMLINYFSDIEKPYLTHGTDAKDLVQNIENIRALLSNKNPENIDLAFGLLSGGGFPKELLTDMLLIYKGNYKPMYKNKAAKYIEQYGSTALWAGIKRRFLLWGYIRPATLAKTINFYGAFEDIDKIKLIELLYQKGQRRVIGAILEHFSSTKKAEFIRSCINEGILDWSNTDLRELPEELALFKAEIKELNLNGSYFNNSFPKVVLQLENLKTLHIRNKWWNKEKFPKEILKMPKLKDIYISRRKLDIPSPEELEEHGCQLHFS